MAVTAKFLADFSDFTQAVDKATVKIRDFATEPSKVEKALSRMTDAFSGRQLIADATLAAEAVERIGGTSKLTEAELQRVATQAAAAAEKLRLMGQDVPEKIAKLAAEVKPLPEQLSLVDKAANALKGSFTQLTASFTLGNLLSQGITTLGNWTREAVDSAGVVVDLASKTGLSTEAIQRMSFVADQTSTSLESFTKAAFQLGVRLSSGGSSVSEAVSALGESLAELQTLKPEEQFDRIVRALERVENPQKRNQLAVALYGKTAEEILPAVAQGYSKIADAATVAGDAQVKAVDAASDRWNAFKKNLQAGVVSTLGNELIAADQLAERMRQQGEQFKSLQQGLLAASSIAVTSLMVPPSVASASTEAVASYVEKLAEARKESADLTAEQRRQIAAATELGKSVQDLADEYGVSVTAIKLFNESLKIQNDLMGVDTLQKASALLDVLSRMEKEGVRPASDAFDDIVKSMTEAQHVMESTGQAGEAMYQRLEAARRKFSGLTPEGLLPSTHLGIPTAQAPNIDQSPSELGNLLQDIQQAIDKEFEWNSAIDDTQAGLVDVTQAQKQAGDASAAATRAGIDGYKELHRAILDATTAIKLAIPESDRLKNIWTEAYKAAGFFVDINSGAVRGGNPSKPNGGAMGGSPVVVNMNVPHGFSAAGAQATADAVGRAILNRIGRA